MDLEKDTLMDLFGKYENGLLSHQEKVRFFQWYAEADWDTFEETFALYHRSVARHADASSLAENRERLLEAMDQEDDFSSPVVRKINWRYWSAAAALVLLFVGWYVAKKEHTPSAIPSIQTLSVAPGGNKATLTLGNGSRIVLDSAGNGTLANQGGSQIVKLGGGLLAYRAVPAKAATEVFFNTVETPRGGEYQLILPDGTHVWLNAASSIRYPTTFSGTNRTVAITGEAYLDVAKDPSRPFRITAADLQVQVLGTAVDVMAYNDEAAVKTTLINGAVKVTAGGVSKLLRPGQQAGFEKSDRTLSLSSPDIEEVVAWKEGKFLFTNTSLKTIMRQIGRWYDVDVTYAGDVDHIYFSGVMSRRQYAAQLLEILALDKRVRFVIKEKSITVIPVH